MSEFSEALDAMILTTARNMAARHNLVCDDGSIVCWDCRKEYALMPSLHCAHCLAAAYAHLHITNPQCVNVEQNVRTSSGGHGKPTG